MRKIILALWLAASLAPEIHGAECTHLWRHNLEINSEEPKPWSADTFAAYGLLGFRDQPGLRLEMRGEFPNGRFMSFQSYRTKDKLPHHALFDYQIAPDSGSANPYQEGAPMETPHRSYTVQILGAEDPSPGANVVRLAPDESIHSIYYRIYVPSSGVTITQRDLPRIFAYNALTGMAAECPDTVNTDFDPGALVLILNLVRPKRFLDFRVPKNFPYGNNAAIPKYLYALNRVSPGQVTVVKFKVPGFFNSLPGTGPFTHDTDVRYWSLCSQDLKKNATLGCIPDYLAKVDGNGFTHIAVGRGDDVRAKAAELGYSYLEDRRNGDTPVLGLFYRNMLPRENFPMYHGDYRPKGVTCSRGEFLRGGCSAGF